jgi:citrate synthase
MSVDIIARASEEILKRNKVDRNLYEQLDVKRGLRNVDGSGVLAGLSKISGVTGSKKIDGKPIPVDGQLMYRGIDIVDLVEGIQKESRHGFAEVVYLLLLGKLPTASERKEFEDYLYPRMKLPNRLVATNILQYTSPNVMNALQKVVLTLYVLDEHPDDISIPNVLRQSLELIAKFPTIIAYAFLALRNKFKGEALFINPPRLDYDIAENFLYMLRPDGEFTSLEAELLDLALVLHAEHGGGNNSTFSTHVVTSSHTDTFSAIAAAIGSLKGPLHGAANANVMSMMRNIKENVKDWADRDEVSDYIGKIIRKEAHNRTGLVYGLGHAVYTKSDPRAIILNQKGQELAELKGRTDEYQLYNLVAEVTPGLFEKIKISDKVISPNVDYFSGFVYDMLGFPEEIYTPLFAMARVAGWSAHRIDELINGGRIIRPAYKSVAEPQRYVPMKERS